MGTQLARWAKNTIDSSRPSCAAEEGRLYTTTSLPSPDSVQLDRLIERSDGITLAFSTNRPAVPCPDCNQHTDHVHSHYQRKLGGLPISGQAVTVILTTRKFFCRNGACSTSIFTERLPGFVDRYGRRTQGLQLALRVLGLALGGRQGIRLAESLGFCSSRETILRGIKRWVRTRSSEKTVVRRLGIDDWAYRKGQSYGTILVDLDRHAVIDILPGRSKEVVIAWLKEHPEVEYISRDRGGAYAEAGREAAPNAIQVADRFHLVKNAVEMMERWLAGEQKVIRELFEETALEEAACEEGGGEKAAVASPELSEPGQEELTGDSSKAGCMEKPDEAVEPKCVLSVKDKRRQAKMERYQTANHLHNNGVSITEIARQLNVKWRTARRLVQADSFPEAATWKKPSRLKESHREYLDERWTSGCHNGATLFRELKERGYAGGYMTVGNYLKVNWRSQSPDGKRKGRTPTSRPSPRQLSWLLLYPEATLDHVERREGKRERERQSEALAKLTDGDSALKQGMLLTRKFTEIVSKRQAHALDDWINDAKQSGAPVLIRFAQGVEKDYDAIRASLDFDISNGQVEGQVNRLKTKKRMMYGKAGNELLKAMLIAH